MSKKLQNNATKKMKINPQEAGQIKIKTKQKQDPRNKVKYICKLYKYKQTELSS